METQLLDLGGVTKRPKKLSRSSALSVSSQFSNILDHGSSRHDSSSRPIEVADLSQSNRCRYSHGIKGAEEYIAHEVIPAFTNTQTVKNGGRTRHNNTFVNARFTQVTIREVFRSAVKQQPLGKQARENSPYLQLHLVDASLKICT